jgi:tripeptidyl-peptidase-1
MMKLGIAWAQLAFFFTVAVKGRPSLSALHHLNLHERRDVPSRAWIKRDRVLPSAHLPVKIGLKQQNLDKGYGYLMDVSDPSSPNYAKHWTEDQIHEAFAPLPETVDAVRRWLVASGIAGEGIQHSANKGWLHFNATAEHVEGLLNTEFYEHEHVSNGKWSIGCDEYHLPSHLSHHIDYVSPGVKHRQLRKRTILAKRPPHIMDNNPALHQPFTAESQMHANLSNCDVLITPACIAALYDIPKPSSDVAKGNALGIFEEGDFYAQKDLDLFFAKYTPWIPEGTHPTLDSVDGGKAPVPVTEAGGESDLDFQLAYPIVYPQEIVLYQVDDSNYATGGLPNLGFGNTFLDALDGSYCNYTAFGETGNDPAFDPAYPDSTSGGYNGPLMCGTYKPTNVISISYGEQEIDLPPGYQQRQCNEFLKLGLQGVSIFVASGDTGVAGVAGTNSAANGCLGSNGTIFNPTNPNSCPYVTNVGATMIAPNKTVEDDETAAWSLFSHGTVLFTSSGGFSNIYPVPHYQRDALETFFDEHEPSYPSYKLLGGFNASKVGGGIYNRIGRGIPDVAANGVSLGIYYKGELRPFGGTSASSPIFASIVTRINDARLSMGKRPIGFINPALYQNPEILNDITNGTNPGCGTKGFEAVEGWDPVTGLGTPNYPKMLRFFTSLQ